MADCPLLDKYWCSGVVDTGSNRMTSERHRTIVITHMDSAHGQLVCVVVGELHNSFIFIIIDKSRPSMDQCCIRFGLLRAVAGMVGLV